MKLSKLMKRNTDQSKVDGYYGEQCTIEQAGEILYQGIGEWETYREVWERSKRILDIKEDEKWAIRTKVKN